ncbi:MAG: hypothetical protein CM15mP128_2900 [Methanobacteriota archaeon]|nr:MAG: hypothetical protein CM15mP128_2900 [Euryarchaeota archaeon]
MGTTAFIALGIFAVGTLLGLFGWQLLLLSLLGMNVNTVHRWAHSTPRDLHWMIRALQKARVIQTPQHHALHHGLPRVTHYCAFTNWMNPVLERASLLARCRVVHRNLDRNSSARRRFAAGFWPDAGMDPELDQKFKPSARERRAAEA